MPDTYRDLLAEAGLEEPRLNRSRRKVRPQDLPRVGKTPAVGRLESARRLAVDTARAFDRGIDRATAIRTPRYLRERYAPPDTDTSGDVEGITVTAPRLTERQRNRLRGERERRELQPIIDLPRNIGAAFAPENIQRAALMAAQETIADPTGARRGIEATGLPEGVREAVRGYRAERRGEREEGGRRGARAVGQTAMAASLLLPQLAAVRGTRALTRALPRRAGGTSFVEAKPMRGAPVNELDLVGDFAEPVSRSGRAANPIVPLSVVGGATLAAGAGETEAQEASSPELQRLSTQITDLENEAEYYRNVGRNQNNKNLVEEMQGRLNIAVDGDWKGETIAAVDRRQAAIETQMKALQDRRDRLEEAAASRATRPEPWLEAARVAAPYAGLLVGGVLGHLSRSSGVRAARKKLTESNAQADAYLTPRADPLRRAANLNEFFVRGGAGERVPYTMTESARGFRRRPRAAEPSTLFPPKNELVRFPDIGIAVAGGADASVSLMRLQAAERDIEEARAALKEERSEDNLRALQDALNRKATWEAALSAGLGLVGSRAGSAFFDRYPNARPNVSLAEREIGRLNRILARDAAAAKAARASRKPKPQPPKPTRRRRP